MRNSVRLRVGRSFKDDNHEDLTKFIEWLRSAINDITQSLQRTMISMILFIAAFELVAQSPNTQISIGPFRINEGSVILIFIPALVAYLYMEAQTTIVRLMTARIAFKSAFAKWNASAEQYDLHLFTLASMPPYYAVGAGAERKENASSARKIGLPATAFLGILVSYGPIAYEVQAYYRLYNRSHISVQLLFSTCIAAICIVAGYSYYLVYTIMDHRRNDVGLAQRFPRLSPRAIPAADGAPGGAISGNPSTDSDPPLYHRKGDNDPGG